MLAVLEFQSDKILYKLKSLYDTEHNIVKVITMKIRKHDCGDGFKGRIIEIKRPFKTFKACDFCGKEVP
jgi:hypothetical protein